MKNKTSPFKFILIAIAIAIASAAALPSSAETSSAYDKVYKWNKAIYDTRSTNEEAINFYKENKGRGWFPVDDPEIVKLAGSITQNKTDEYDKAKAIYDWVTNNISYDYDYLSGKPSDLKNHEKSGIVSVLGAVKYKRGTCNHIAHLTVTLLRASDIAARIIYGHSEERDVTVEDYLAWIEECNGYDWGNHLWAEAYVNGKWIIIDPTYGGNSAFIDGKYHLRKPNESKYFDISLEELSKHYVIAMRYDIFVTHIAIPDGALSIGLDGLTWWGEGYPTHVRAMTIPASVKTIEKNTFAGMGSNITIYGDAGSYAEEYANARQGLKFVAVKR